MAVIIETKYPHTLIAIMCRMIDDGEIDTWSCDKDGDFTHTSQWANNAWMSPKIKDNIICFNIVGRKNVTMTIMEYSIYHGRFVELLLNHFAKDITSINITLPLETKGDCDRISF